MAYLGGMGRLILMLVGAVIAVAVVLWIIHVVMFYFLLAVVAVAGFGLFRLGRWSSSRGSRG
jgi:hypothetical protein